MTGNGTPVYLVIVKMVDFFANSEGPDQILHSAKSDLSLHCLPRTRFGVNKVHMLLTETRTLK